MKTLFLIPVVIAAAAVVSVSGRDAGAAGQKNAPKAAPDAAKKSPFLKLAQPWPSAEEMHQQKIKAEGRPLFAAADPIAITLAGDFKVVNKDHDGASVKRYPAELRFAREDGRIDVIPVKLGARGHVRRMARTCEFVPLRVEFPKDHVKDTPFEGQSALKLVVQCNNGNDFEQYTFREFLAYRIFNLLTPRSVRARLAKITYVDSTSNKTIGVRYGMFLEDDSDVAKRMEGRTVKLPHMLFTDLDADTLETMMVFEYMIGNTDYSLYAVHNVIFVQTPDRTVYPVPYDFDISGLVHPPYAIPSRSLSIKSVDDRLYRGPCRPIEQVDPILANFNAKRELIQALPESIPGFSRESRQAVKTFLDGFYGSVKNTKDVRRLFVDGCSKAPTM